MRYFFLLIFLNTFLISDSWNGQEYSKNSLLQLTHAELLLKNLDLKGSELILDLGCGNGKITAYLAEKAPQGMVYGIDPSLSMIETALNSQASYSNLKFKQGSAEDFTQLEKFDHIIAVHVMQWVDDQKQALQNIYSHLKPGGQIHFVITPSKDGLPFATALKRTLSNWEDEFIDFENPQHFFDPESYRKLLVDSGFKIDAIHYILHESIHEDKEALKNWIQQWLPHSKYLSSSQKTLFLDELMDHYLKEIGLSAQTTKQVSWQEYVLFVEATKPFK